MMDKLFFLCAAPGMFLVLTLTLALAGPPASAGELPAGAAALVNGKAVSTAALDDAMRQSGQADSPALRAMQKGRLVARAVLAQQAEKEGYATRPDVARALQDAQEATLAALYLRDRVRPAAVTEEQVRERYRRIVGSLGKKEYKVRIIRLADDAAALAVLAQLKAGAAFDALASRHSLAPSRNEGGALDWVSFPEPAVDGQTQGLPLALAQAIASLPPGSASAAPIAAGDARYLVKLEQVRPVTVPAYDEVAPGLRRALETQELQRALGALLAELIGRASISQ